MPVCLSLYRPQLQLDGLKYFEDLNWYVGQLQICKGPDFDCGPWVWHMCPIAWATEQPWDLRLKGHSCSRSWSSSPFQNFRSFRSSLCRWIMGIMESVFCVLFPFIPDLKSQSVQQWLTRKCFIYNTGTVGCRDLDIFLPKGIFMSTVTVTNRRRHGITWQENNRQ